jgi:hypothetical protein
MTPGKLDLVLYQGATFKRVIYLADSTPNPIDLTILNQAFYDLHTNAQRANRAQESN